jgi:hypothetical protein
MKNEEGNSNRNHPNKANMTLQAFKEKLRQVDKVDM